MAIRHKRFNGHCNSREHKQNLQSLTFLLNNVIPPGILPIVIFHPQLLCYIFHKNRKTLETFETYMHGLAM
jgi:hypothetical protein